jgi:excinuclease UvrABC nuclease subunit
MELAAAELDFERAAMLRDGIREVERATIHATDRPLAVSDTNVLIIIPVGERNTTLEVYAMRSGRLVFQREVGLRAPRGGIIQEIERHFTTTVEPKRFTSRELDELQIITSWLYRKRERAHTAIVHDPTMISDLVHEAFNSFDTERVQRAAQAPPSEYSQLPEYDDFGV